MARIPCLQCLILPRNQILLLLVFVLIVVLPVLLEGNASTDWMSPRTPAIVQSSDLSHLSLNRVLFPAGPALDDRSWIAENQRTISALFRCIEANSCTQNQTKVVLLVASPFRELLEGANGGEAIWANSTLIALRRLGYNYLYSNSMARASQLYHIFGALIPVVFVDVPDAYSCFQDENCILSRLRPHGIPAWKILSFHFWDSPDNPLGRRWTLSPEDYRGSEGNTYLGYSVEPQCSRQPFVPHSHRKEQAYVLAKEARYFAPDVDRAHDPDSFEAAAAAIDIRFLAGVRERVLPEYFPRNITNVGFMSAPQFYATLAESRVLVGVGVPFTSPTPWEALCLGVPFINPIHHWSADAPLDKTHWVSQHAALKHLDPPYVYNVFKGDKAGFVRAVVDAIAHPIQSFVAEDMRMRAVEVRLAAVFETDWRSEAARLLAEQQASGSGEAFWL